SDGSDGGWFHLGFGTGSLVNAGPCFSWQIRRLESLVNRDNMLFWQAKTPCVERCCQLTPSPQANIVENSAGYGRRVWGWRMAGKTITRGDLCGAGYQKGGPSGPEGAGLTT